MKSKKKIQWCVEQMHELFPDAAAELVGDTPFQFLVAVILSAQATDVSVNLATPALFAKFPTAAELATASLVEIESYVKTIGLYKSKARNIKKTAAMIAFEYDGQVPESMEELMKLPGVGRKTANVVRGEIYHIPGIAVDTHVERVSKRLMFVPQKATVLEVEEKLRWALPEEKWIKAHHTLIFFGRYHCKAKKPLCEICPLQAECLYYRQHYPQAKE